ncbi:hypothetical protein [Streptomyces sp. NRRL WC-3626]|uniref:hypothetical protein n=1 Tax=Streptomyces sp. NRRL WC-3626 TaxID=1463926 RepID=UPI00131C7A99|nr:hypothetical protein [Streptomyces sp. NRRL WC-3626]
MSQVSSRTPTPGAHTVDALCEDREGMPGGKQLPENLPDLTIVFGQVKPGLLLL